MIHADLALARRLERAEGLANRAFVQARQGLHPDRGADWTEITGALALYDGSESPLTQTFGLGVFAEPSDADLVELESFFFDRGASVFHEVSPLAPGNLGARLAARGYRPIEHSSALFLDLSEAPTLDSTPGVLARPINAEETDLWVEIGVAGWAEEAEYADLIADLFQVSARMEVATPVIAEIDGKPVATGLSHRLGDVMLLAGASTIPSARRLGAQRALTKLRLEQAVSSGLELAMVVAEPGSASQRNAERIGFRVAYTRTKWGLDRTDE